MKKQYIKLIILFVALFASSCFDQAKQTKSQTHAIIKVPCSKSYWSWSFRRNLTNYETDELLGSGLFGKVYSLKKSNQKNDKWANTHVLKTLPKEGRMNIQQLGQSEEEIYKIFGGDLIVKTKFLGTSQRKNASGGSKEFAMILKKRVKGYTLYEYFQKFDSLISNLDQALLMKKKLKDFQDRLTQKMKIVANQKGVFLVDLHASNVMWDEIDERWLIVDGLLMKGRSEFIAFIESTADHHTYSESALATVKSNAPFDQAFFRHMIDYYNHTESIVTHFKSKIEELDNMSAI